VQPLKHVWNNFVYLMPEERIMVI